MHSIIDTICHIDDSAFDQDRSEVIENSQKQGVDKIVVPSITFSNWDKVKQLGSDYDFLYPAFGLHPMFVSEHDKGDINELDNYLKDYASVAIGEIGLDFYDQESDRSRQEWFFEQQIDLAIAHDMPLILHVRKAHAEVISQLKESNFKCGGTVHAFNGSIELANEYIKLGFKLGFGGMLTNPNASNLHKLASELPLNAIVLETNAPDLSGIKHKGERNSPEYLPEVLADLADIRAETIDRIALQTSLNANEALALEK